MALWKTMSVQIFLGWTRTWIFCCLQGSVYQQYHGALADYSVPFVYKSGIAWISLLCGSYDLEHHILNFFIVFLGFVVFLAPVLREISIAVVLGALLYLGYTSLFCGIQFLEQLRLFFTPVKYQPNKKYIYLVRINLIIFHNCEALHLLST